VRTWYDQSFRDRLTKSHEEEQLALTNAEILQSITEIQQAVNDMQEDDSGFSIIDSQSLLASGASGSDRDALIIKPGRPLLFPSTKHSHTFLVLVRPTSEGTDLWAIDSDRGNLMANDNEEVRKTIIELLHRTKWNVLPDTPLPNALGWVSGAQQSEGWQAGYYTILNAWSILLGFRPDPNFAPSDPGFFQAAAVIVRLTLGQFTDWKLMWAFQHCHGFILDKTVRNSGAESAYLSVQVPPRGIWHALLGSFVLLYSTLLKSRPLTLYPSL
jgi:hypothetical protein